MNVSEHFEVAVIGGTLSATLISSLLSERRYRGVLIDQGELSQDASSGLSDLVLMDNSSAIMQFIHSELRINDRLARQTEPLDTFLQLVYPDERIDVTGKRKAVLGEFGRGFGNSSARELDSLLAQLDALEERSSELLAEVGVLPVTGFLAKRSAAGSFRKHKEFRSTVEGWGEELEISSEVREFLLGMLPFLTYIDARDVDSVHLLQLVRPVLRFLRGVSRFQDGKGLRHIFEQHARRGGFNVYQDAVEQIEYKNKRHILSLTESRRQISCDYIIDASSDLSGLDVLPSKQQRSLARTLQDARPKGSLHTFAFEVDKSVVPPGMADNVLLLNGRNKSRDVSRTAVQDRPILLIMRPVPAKSKPPHKGKVNERVRLIALQPLSSAESHVTTEIDNVIRARIRRVIPFLDQGNPRSQTLFSSEKKRLPATLMLHPHFDASLDEIWGITGIPNVTSIKTVMVAGPPVIPGLGLEGEYISSLQACDELDRRSRGTKWPKSLAKRVGMAVFS